MKNEFNKNKVNGSLEELINEGFYYDPINNWLEILFSLYSCDMYFKQIGDKNE